MNEKPSIQAIERSSGYVETDSGAIVRTLKSTYKRHRTLNLFAAPIASVVRSTDLVVTSRAARTFICWRP
jgi:hypothetical protein